MAPLLHRAAIKRLDAKFLRKLSKFWCQGLSNLRSQFQILLTQLCSVTLNNQFSFDKPTCTAFYACASVACHPSKQFQFLNSNWIENNIGQTPLDLYTDLNLSFARSMETTKINTTIPNSIGTVFAPKWRPLSCNWNGALKKSATGCLWTVSN